MHSEPVAPPLRPSLTKCPTGISGLDEITHGGLPHGRPTLVCGGAGSGKTLLAMEFIVRGARDFGEPGVFVAFEETEEELAANVASLGFDLPQLIAQHKIALDYVYIERSEIEATGQYDLEGLFVRLAAAIDQVGAKRVAIDSLEALFYALPDEAILRAELRRLFRWLKQRGLTAVITGEQGKGTLTRHGLEEYISDCVIFLDHRVVNQVATRRLRVVKYRGTSHGTNEYPTMIDENGLSVLPVSTLRLDHEVSPERIPSGVPGLDEMLSGQGFFRGSSVLLSGSAGTGKSSFAAAFANAACRRGERCLYFAFEESPAQLVRNMASIGIDLGESIREERLRIQASRPTLHGLEQHLVTIHKLVQEFAPDCVVVDPVTNLAAVGDALEITAMLTRVVDFLKQQGITSLFVGLTHGGTVVERSDSNISSLMDTWILLRQEVAAGTRRRQVEVVKSRGMPHSTRAREFRFTQGGIEMEQDA